MLSHLFILAAVVGLLPLSLDGRQSTETTAGLVTQPGYSHAEGDGFAVDPEGLVRVIVLLSPDQRENVKLLAELLPTAQIDRRYTYLIQGLALRLEPADLPALRAHPGVQAVYPDARVEAALADSVPLVGAPQVWALADAAGQPATGQGVQVAVLDTGVDYTHPALGGCLGRNCRVTGGYDFVYNDDDPLDDHGHGTHVAGVIAADGLLQGVAPGANLLAYKVLNENGVGYASDVIAGLERALLDGADVVNLSLGASVGSDDPVSLAAQAAVDKGCVVVAAAGNRGPRAFTVEAPGIAPGVIAVTAADKEDNLADFAGRGPVPGSFDLKPDLTAPGIQISSTVSVAGPGSDPGGWLPASGTSVAAPHVAGGAALLRQLFPEWTPAEIKAAMMNYALDLGENLYAQGAGRLDLASTTGSPLLAVPGSLSFGLPLLDGTDVLTLTLRNLYPASQEVTPILSLAYVADGVGRPIAPPKPIPYASVAPQSLLVPPRGMRVVTITLDIPAGAEDGYYQGRLDLQAKGAARPASVPLAFTLLSRVTVRVVDAVGEKVTGRGHLAVLVRVPEADVVVSNVPLKLPAVFTVPAGTYYAQAYGHFGIYDHLLIPDQPPQVPYAAIQPVAIQAHAVQTVTLDLADSRLYWLDATDAEGNPAFINSWTASFHYRDGDTRWLTRLGQSYVRVLNTDLPDHWPAAFPVLLSDTPPGVAFHLALQGAGFSPRYRDFVQRNGSRWPASPSGGFGFPLVGSADRVEYLAWERPALDATTMPTFTVTASDLTRYAVRTDLPGLLERPQTGWEASAESWLDLLTGAGSSLEPAAPGLSRTLMVYGAHHAVYRMDYNSGSRIFHQPFYSADWSQTYPWGEDPDVLFPDESVLKPQPPGSDSFTLGAGPFFPAVAFDNQPDAIQMRHPLLAGASASPVVWGTIAPTYTLAFEGAPAATATLPEFNWVPLPLRRWPDLSPGAYELTITFPREPAGNRPGVIQTGFSLSDGPSADLNPPQVVDVTLAQRFDPTKSLTVTWSLTDTNPVTLTAAVQLGDAPWTALAVEPLDDGGFWARIEPRGAPKVSLSYTATDSAGNWLAWQTHGQASAVAQVPLTLAFQLYPAVVPWGHQAVTVRIVGTLLGPGGEPLGQTPVWLRLRAGSSFVGYVRDVTGFPGSYDTGIIDFPWTFVPAELTDAPGPLPVSLELDMGLYAPQKAIRTLVLRPHVYLPLVFRGRAR